MHTLEIESKKITSFGSENEGSHLSLGDTEAKARNEVLRSVQENTERICAFWNTTGIQTTFELNKGNHFVDSEISMARGIKWILEH